MKKFFYLFYALCIAVSLSAQTPGGVSGSVLWLKANTGAGSATWTDYSGMANDFHQATPANQPAVNTNVFNFNPALSFNGTSSFMDQPAPTGFPTGNNDRSIFVVANASATNSYRWILAYGTVGSASGTCQTGNFGGALTNAFYGSPADIISANYWDNVTNTNGALATFTINSNTETLYNRGIVLTSQVNITTLTAGSVNAVIGAINTVPAELWAGNIAEVILFNTALTSAQRNQVESYLALKYGFTLGSNSSPLDYAASDGTIYWANSSTYQNDVFGIGTDNGTSLSQVQSNSTNSGSGDGTGQNISGNLVLSVGSALADKQFLLIGNDGGSLAEHLIVPSEAPTDAVGSQRVLRNWKVQNTGTVGTVDLSFDISGLSVTGGTTASNYRLMIDGDGDGDYTTGTVTYAIPSSFSGNRLIFTGITLANNAVFTVLTQASAFVLPAVWEGFAVSLQKAKATLVWKTSDEINVDHYVVEYSTDGTVFKPAGTVVANNNGAGQHVYTFAQDNLPAGTRYYRVRRVDKDGQFQLSDVKSVRPGGLSAVTVRSNPVTKDALELNIDVAQNQKAVIRIVSINGRILVQQNIGLTTGSNAIKTSTSHLAAGTYFLQVQLSNEIVNRKFVRL
ncbi:MAG: T9SS type A sorting domain-containing protein [Bacteroidota bacterium]